MLNFDVMNSKQVDFQKNNLRTWISLPKIKNHWQSLSILQKEKILTIFDI